MRRLRHLTGQHRTASTNRLLGALLAFVAGAACTAVLVNWARQNHLRSEYALPLLLGATLNRQTPFAVPLTVLVLAFTMGLQNALVSKISASQIRTTHMTGVITDMGIELGKLFYWNQGARPPELQVRANRIKVRLHAMLLGAFMAGGVVGAAGFKYLGFVWVLPMAGLLLLMSLPPLWSDCLRYRRRHGMALPYYR